MQSFPGDPRRVIEACIVTFGNEKLKRGDRFQSFARTSSPASISPFLAIVDVSRTSSMTRTCANHKAKSPSGWMIRRRAHDFKRSEPEAIGSTGAESDPIRASTSDKVQIGSSDAIHCINHKYVKPLRSRRRGVQAHFGHSPFLIGRSLNLAGSITACLIRRRFHVYVICTKPSVV